MMSLLTHKKLLQSLENNLSNIVEQLNMAEPVGQAEDFSHTDLLRRLGAAAAALAHNISKLALVFKERPLPTTESSQPLCATAEEHALALLAEFMRGNKKAAGKYFTKEVRGCCQEAVAATAAFASVLRSSLSQKQAESAARVTQAAGAAWEKCDMLATGSVSLTSGLACAKVLRSERATVADAVKELEEALAEDHESDRDEDEFSCSWSPTEREMVAPCLGLMKAAQATLRRAAEVVASADLPSYVSQVDEVTDELRGLSAAVDDLAACLYPPLDAEEAAAGFANLRSILATQLDSLLARPFVTEAHKESWGRFIAKALEHNETKFEAALAAVGVEKLSLKV